ncbi:GNAT family N-acetyltransferase [Sanguibacter antarcticus]|uniref:GNAT family N-acetyltransferase n=1 Tax=Sanguibacter antarcticus TaxID=372484 RepID=UPI001FEA6030|nr:GNAT family N-acetyltransferase [Sanguibacter antarcticus]
MSTQAFSIRRTTGDDWREVRDLRLEMLRDTPTGYIETLEQALAHGDAEWRMRGERGSAEHQIVLAAISGSGRWVGTMRGLVLDPEVGPLLVGVYVAPDVRGAEAGVADALLTGIEAWARTEGDRLTLHVHEDNVRARTFYDRRGFTATGHTVPYTLDPTKNEVEMVRTL